MKEIKKKLINHRPQKTIQGLIETLQKLGEVEIYGNQNTKKAIVYYGYHHPTISISQTDLIYSWLRLETDTGHLNN